MTVLSLAGRNGSRLSGPQYPAAKAEILGLTRHLAQDLGPFNITEYAVAPGPTLVDRITMKWADRSREEQAQILANIPLGRLDQPEEIATVIAFYACCPQELRADSPNAAYPLDLITTLERLMRWPVEEETHCTMMGPVPRHTHCTKVARSPCCLFWGGWRIRLSSAPRLRSSPCPEGAARA